MAEIKIEHEQIIEILENRITTLKNLIDNDKEVSIKDIMILLCETYEFLIEQKQIIYQLNQNNESRNERYKKFFDEKKEKRRINNCNGGLYT